MFVSQIGTIVGAVGNRPWSFFRIGVAAFALCCAPPAALCDGVFHTTSSPSANGVLEAAYGSNSSDTDKSAAFQAAAERSQQVIIDCGSAGSPCIAQELDRYADWIESVAPQLPAELGTLPSIIRRAAVGLRAARTRAEAVRAVRTAISDVRKTIALVRADEPSAKAVAKREATFTVDTLVVARNELEKATGL